MWTEAHTEALNTLGDRVWRRLKLCLANPQKALYLHVDVSDTDLSVVLT